MVEIYWYKEVIPFTAMVALEVMNVGVNTLFKAGTNKGMSFYVFIVYSYVICSFILLPFFCFYRRTVLPPLCCKIIGKLFFLGAIGAVSLLFGYKGIEYSSPTLASAMCNLIPAFTFVLAVLFRMEKLAWRSFSSQAKVSGTVVSITGALVIILYKGPSIMSIPLKMSMTYNKLVLQSSNSNEWITGGVLLSADYILSPVSYIVQAHIMKEYPAEFVVVFFYIFFAGIVSGAVSSVTEPDRAAWILKPDISTIAIVYSGVFEALYSGVHAWIMQRKGPFYVAMFKPLSIAIAAAMSVIFLGDTLYLGRRTVLPPLCSKIIGKLFFLGAIGAVCLLFGYKGIEYSSPTLASAMSNLIPAFTFVLAVLFRMEKLAWRSFSSQAKVTGTIVSITGALVIILYKGPSIMSIPLKLSMTYNKLALQSSNSNEWIIGGALLGTDYILSPVWYIVQAHIMKEYPAEFVVVFFYSFFAAIVSGAVSSVTEPNRAAWVLKPDISTIAIVYSGVFEAVYCGIHAWIMQRKGPFYIAMFKPLSIAIAAAMSVIFLGDTLYLGSIIGAVVITLGFYTVMWGKIREESYNDLGYADPELSSCKDPLLQNSKSEVS